MKNKCVIIYSDASGDRIGNMGIGVHIIVGHRSTKSTKKENFYITQLGYSDTDDKDGILVEKYIDLIIPINTNDSIMENIIGCEAMAVYSALEYIYNNTEDDVDNIIIYTDCKVVCDYINKKNIIVENNFRNNKGNLFVDHKVLKKLYKVIDGLSNTNISVSHVVGHTGNIGNTISDALSKIACTKSSLKDFDTDIKIYSEYWAVNKKSSFLSKNIVFFNSDNTNYIMNATNKDAGSVDAGVSFVVTDTYDQICSKMKEHMKKYDCNVLMSVDLLDIFKNKVFINLYLKYDNLLYKHKKNFSHTFIGEKFVMNAVPDQFKKFVLISILNKLSTLLEYSIKNSNNINYFNVPIVSEKVKLFDITEYFFTQDVSKNKSVFRLNNDIKQNTEHVMVNIEKCYPDKDVLFKLVLGDDCYDRNTLNKISVDIIKVYLCVEYESENSLIYHTIFVTILGNSICSSYYTNRVIVRR